MSLHGPKDMPSIVQHRLQLLPHVRPVKQKLRRLHSQWSLKVKGDPKAVQCWIYISSRVS